MDTRLFLSTLFVVSAPSVGWGQWSPDGVPISIAAGDQGSPSIMADGSGGAIIAWNDTRNGTFNADIYIQRINAAGIPLWANDGVAICTAASTQADPVIVSDGAGGAIVAWRDARSGDYDVYAQRVDALGVPQWTADGVALCTATLSQGAPTAVSDATGGAIVAWQDGRFSLLSGDFNDIYAQRVGPSGAVQWTVDALAICNAFDQQTFPAIVSDEAGGAILAWRDQRNNQVGGTFARRIHPSAGSEWATDGIAFYSATNIYQPRIAADGAGGAIVTWYTDNPVMDIYVHRVSNCGAVQWTSNGVVLCSATGNQLNPEIVSDGAEGAIVAWIDNRSGDYDVYVRRVSSSGTPQWTPDGVALCTAVGRQNLPEIVSNGTGGALVTWKDERVGLADSDIYAQQVDASGAVQWVSDGVALCTAASAQDFPVIVSDGAGGAIVVWRDNRNGNRDLYAQRVAASGQTPTAVNHQTRTPALMVGMNYPNPFSTTTSLEVELGAPSDVRVEVFDVAGRSVRETTLKDLPAGWSRLELDGRNNAGRLLASGVYFCRVTANGATATHKIVIER